MRFSEYVAREGKGVLSRVMRSTGLAWGTIVKASQGRPVTYPVAKKISDATGGEVSVASLCETGSIPPPPSSAGEAA
jgi:hypothetical protein